MKVQLQSEWRFSRDYGSVGHERMLGDRNRILSIFQTQKQMYDSLMWPSRSQHDIVSEWVFDPRGAIVDCWWILGQDFVKIFVDEWQHNNELFIANSYQFLLKQNKTLVLFYCPLNFFGQKKVVLNV